MSKNSNEVKSFCLNELGDKLIEEYIQKRKDFFETITIVTPNYKIGQWFKSYWLKKHNSVLVNVKYIPINKALSNFIKIENQYSILSNEQLKSLILKNLLIEDENIILPDNIKKYLKDEDIKAPIKIYDVANQLAKLFTQYEEEQYPISGWEGELYKKVLSEAAKYNLSTTSYIYNELANQQVIELKSNIFFFGFVEFTNLQNEIVNKLESKNQDKVIKFVLEKNNEYTNEFEHMAAPSRLREIEAVHTKICELLKNDNETIKYSDILVLAPDISVYENIIPRVFKQDNENFPNIPYVINSRKKVETNLFLVLKNLFEILNKKFYTRYDFSTLINNKNVKATRGISDEETTNWLESIIKMNAYRNSENRDDWEYVRNRLLLSKVADTNDINNIIEIGDNSYIPFSNINFTDESIVKFVTVIDDLSNWLSNIGSIKYISKYNLELIKTELSKWVSIKDDNGFETNGYYKSILNVLSFLQEIEIPDNKISINTLFYMLFDLSRVTKKKVDEYFVKGITFADFDENAILSANYIFFLNGGVSEFPKLILKSELDLRTYDVSKNNKDKLEQAFQLQYQNSIKKFYISYINRDLKTNEKLYISPFVTNLYLKINAEEKNKIEEKDRYKIPCKPIGLDENRYWSQLYTKKSIENKNKYNKLFEVDNSFSKKSIIEKIEFSKNIIDNIVTVNNMAKYLKEPLSYKAEKLFSKTESLDSDIRDEYEPMEVDSLSNYSILKIICLDFLKSKKRELESFEQDKLKLLLKLEHKLPDVSQEILKRSFEKLYERAQTIVNYIYQKTSGNYKIYPLDYKLDERKFDCKLNDETITWVLTCNSEICISEEGNVRSYFEIKTAPKTNNNSDYLLLYIYSLMDIVYLPEDKYTIRLCRGAGREKEFEIDPSKAKDLLNDIYCLMNDYKENVYLPIDIIKDLIDNKPESINSFEDLTKGISFGPWKYYDDKDLFERDTQLGYNNNDDNEFIKKLKLLIERTINLVEYMKENNKGKKQESEAEDNE